MTGISQKKLLKIIYNAIQCFIPTDELTDEQRERLDNITYGLCDCWRCKKVLTSPNIDWKALGHADKRTYSVSVSRDAIKVWAGIKQPSLGAIPIFLLGLIQVILHEIIHILFPEYTEDQVEDKTFEWLNSFNWRSIDV